MNLVPAKTRLEVFILISNPFDDQEKTVEKYDSSLTGLGCGSLPHTQRTESYARCGFLPVGSCTHYYIYCAKQCLPNELILLFQEWSLLN